MKKKSKHAIGAFVRIRLPDGSFAYGRLLEHPYVAFYDHRTAEPSSDIRTIASRSVLFKQAVRTSGIKNWEQLGKEELQGAVAEPVVAFMQDLAEFRKCVIFDTAGNRRDATPEECVGLERASVSEAHGLEERLLDTFMGRPNQEELRSRVRLK